MWTHLSPICLHNVCKVLYIQESNTDNTAVQEYLKQDSRGKKCLLILDVLILGSIILNQTLVLDSISCSDFPQ